jgi:hypothetical protein
MQRGMYRSLLRTPGDRRDDLRRMRGARRSTPSRLPIHRSVGEHVGKQGDEGLKKLIESHVEEEESRGPSRAFANAAVAC